MSFEIKIEIFYVIINKFFIIFNILYFNLI